MSRLSILIPVGMSEMKNRRVFTKKNMTLKPRIIRIELVEHELRLRFGLLLVTDVDLILMDAPHSIIGPASQLGKR